MSTEITRDTFTSNLLNALLTASADTDYGITSFDTGVTTKVNEGSREYITARYGDGIGCAPIVYTDDLYAEFKDTDITITRMAERELAKMQNFRMEMPVLGIPDISPENAQDHLVLQLINTEQNRDLISKCAHIDLEDLSAVPRWKVSDDASVLVTHEVQTRFLQMTDDELLSICTENNTAQDISIKHLGEVISELMGMEIPDGSCDPAYVVRGTDSIWGSTAILSPDALDKIADRIREDTGDENFIIIPSSIYEVLVVGESNVEDPAYYQQMCAEVNETTVEPKDRLSGNIYRYDGSTGTIRICNTLAQMQAQQQHTEMQESCKQHLVTGRRM